MELIYEEIKLGVYIQGVSGKLYTEDEWDSQETTNGVAVITDACSFVIAKEDASSSTLAWGGYGKTITDIVTTTTSATAILDYDGAGNTPKIIEQLDGYTDSYDITGAPAAEACAAYTFPSGKKGYLPALGEWQCAYDNMSAVVSAMTLIGGTIKPEYYWSSTQYNKNQSWYIDWIEDQGPYYYLKIYEDFHYVRAFCSLD